MDFIPTTLSAALTHGGCVELTSVLLGFVVTSLVVVITAAAVVIVVVVVVVAAAVVVGASINDGINSDAYDEYIIALLTSC